MFAPRSGEQLPLEPQLPELAPQVAQFFSQLDR
jgi:hypothetical protein